MTNSKSALLRILSLSSLGAPRPAQAFGGSPQEAQIHSHAQACTYNAFQISFCVHALLTARLILCSVHSSKSIAKDRLMIASMCSFLPTARDINYLVSLSSKLTLINYLYNQTVPTLIYF